MRPQIGSYGNKSENLNIFTSVFLAGDYYHTLLIWRTSSGALGNDICRQ
jgi:hypothetical protein